MLTGRLAGGLIGFLVAAALLAAAIQVQAARERLYPPGAAGDDVVYVTAGDVVRRLSGAYTGLAADLYWIRTIQYYGGTKLRLAARPAVAEPPPLLAAGAPSAYSQLYPLLDITTTLDPRFNIAYRFGAVFLAEPYPGGAGRPDLAVRLLEKGLGERPDRWEYMQDIGFVHYWYLHDYRAASDWFSRAADVTGAPWWLRSLAATTLARGGDRESSRIMWEAIRQSAEVDWLRADASRRLAQLRALDGIDAWQALVDQHTKENGTPPADWQTVVRAANLRAVPADPTGTLFLLEADGRVRLSPSSPLWPLPDEPARTSAR